MIIYSYNGDPFTWEGLVFYELNRENYFILYVIS